MYSVREYAVLLEKAFNSEGIEADDFVRDFPNALEMGFNYLVAKGKVQSKDINGYLENFSDIESLKDVQNDEFKGLQVEGLLKLVRELSKDNFIE